MAKGQVSEEELAKGLKGIGNFGGLTTPRVRRDNPFRDSRSEVMPAEPVKTIELPVAEKRVSRPGSPPAPSRETKPVAKVSAPASNLVEKVRGAQKTTKPASGRKADIFTERVTLQISPEMRDEVERIARELQRAKTSKEERITPNTVMRVAIHLVTKYFQLGGGEAPNTEEELYKLVEGMLTVRRS